MRIYKGYDLGSRGPNCWLMELMQLEMFVAVMEERSVRAASQRVYRTQPAVSVAMRKLEEEIGVPLFDRSSRYDYRLTEAGAVLFHYAKQMLGIRKQTLVALAELSSLRVGRLRIGANESISLHLFPQLAQIFLEQYSGIHIELCCGRSESLLADLKDRKLDLALLSFKPRCHGLETTFIMQDELVLITNRKHRFAQRESVDIGELASESILAMDISRPSPWHHKIRDAFERSNASLNLTIENAPIETIKKMVAIGLGIAFVPRISVSEERSRGELAVVCVQDFQQERSVWLARRKAAHSLAAKAFAKVAATYVRGEHKEDSAGQVRPMKGPTPAKRS